MYITITVEAGTKRFDMAIDERQPVGAAFAALAERGLLPVGHAPASYKSMLLADQIDAAKTFVEQRITSGDRLSAIENGTPKN